MRALLEHPVQMEERWFGTSMPWNWAGAGPAASAARYRIALETASKADAPALAVEYATRLKSQALNEAAALEARAVRLNATADSLPLAQRQAPLVQAIAAKRRAEQGL
jgi:hypothetical protein